MNKKIVAIAIFIGVAVSLIFSENEYYIYHHSRKDRVVKEVYELNVNSDEVVADHEFTPDLSMGFIAFILNVALGLFILDFKKGEYK